MVSINVCNGTLVDSFSTLYCLPPLSSLISPLPIPKTTLNIPQNQQQQAAMADLFLIFTILIGFIILTIIGLYLVVKYQHPDDKNDAYFPKLVVLFGFVLAGATVLLLPLDVANNEGFAGEFLPALFIYNTFAMK
jgi:heme/copper-type cytochrome/quinol oxidase subunit 2